MSASPNLPIPEAGKSPTSPTGAAAPSSPPQISLEEFQRITLRVGVVVSAEDHPNADRLLVLRVDVGEASVRQLVAGIKGAYQTSELVGKHVVVVTNMKTATLRGEESQGMVLAASQDSSLALIIPERSIPAGSVVK